MRFANSIIEQPISQATAFPSQDQLPIHTIENLSRRLEWVVDRLRVLPVTVLSCDRGSRISCGINVDTMVLNQILIWSLLLLAFTVPLVEVSKIRTRFGMCETCQSRYYIWLPTLLRKAAKQQKWCHLETEEGVGAMGVGALWRLGCLACIEESLGSSLQVWTLVNIITQSVGMNDSLNSMFFSTRSSWPWRLLLTVPIIWHAFKWQMSLFFLPFRVYLCAQTVALFASDQ